MVEIASFMPLLWRSTESYSMAVANVIVLLERAAQGCLGLILLLMVNI